MNGRYLHIKDHTGRMRITVVSGWVKLRNDLVGRGVLSFPAPHNYLDMTYAQCHEKETYDRRLGDQILLLEAGRRRIDIYMCW